MLNDYPAESRESVSDNARAVVKWYRGNRRFILLGFVIGIPCGVVSSFLTEHLSFPYLLVSAIVTGIVFGSVYGYVLNRFNRKP